MRIFNYLLLTFFLLQSSIALGTASFLQKSNPDSTDLPTVFIIGEHEDEFNRLGVEYQALLLTACDDNMDMAYDKWLGMLEELQIFAASNQFDLRGIKMWLNVFWDENGVVSHIAYHLKPQSRNVDTRYLTAVLSEFTKTYRFPLVFESKYSHYGTASFPVFPRKVGNGVVPTPGSLQNMKNTDLVKDRN